MNSPVRRFSSVLLVLAFVFATVGQQSLVLQAAESTGLIRGSLVDANGLPLVGYTVRVQEASGQTYESPTGADGTFEIGDLPPGTYTYEILDLEEKPVGVRIPAVHLAAGSIVTQPIAIIPKKKAGGISPRRKAAYIAIPIGAVAVITAIAIANNDDNPPPSMTAGGGN